MRAPMRRPAISALLVPALFPALLAGCPSSGAVAKTVASPPPKLETAGKCQPGKSQLEPLVVEWASTDRAKLEALAKKQLVAVKYQGCELTVLSGCSVKGKYGYTAVTRKQDHVAMRDADELYANVPLGAAKLEAKLQKAGQLTVDMTIVGRFESDHPPPFRKDDLSGECEGATHVVSAMVTGAFTFFTGVGASVEGGASAMGVGTGAKSSTQNEQLAKDGDANACAKSTGSDPNPPEGCGALIRIEVVALGVAKQTQPDCPERTQWDGSQCAAVVATQAAETGSNEKVATPTIGGSTAKKASCTYGDSTGCAVACETQIDAPSCNDLALMFARGDGVSADDKKATEFFGRACDLGSALACNNLGIRFEGGKGGAVDLNRALVSYQRACDHGNGAGCNNLGRLYGGGIGVTKDDAKALAEFGRGCGLEDAGSCANQGWFLVQGRGAAADKGKGLGLLKKACGANHDWACGRLKLLHFMHAD